MKHDKEIRESESIELTIKKLIVDSLKIEIGPEEIPSESSLFEHNLGLDSVKLFELLLTVEELFQIEIPDDEFRVEMFQSVRSLAEYIGRHAGSGALSPTTKSCTNDG